MSASNLSPTKQELIDWISHLNDESLLHFLNAIRQSQQEKGHDWWDELSGTEKENIHAGLQDIQQAKTLTSEEFRHQLKNG